MANKKKRDFKSLFFLSLKMLCTTNNISDVCTDLACNLSYNNPSKKNRFSLWGDTGFHRDQHILFESQTQWLFRCRFRASTHGHSRIDLGLLDVHSEYRCPDCYNIHYMHSLDRFYMVYMR